MLCGIPLGADSGKDEQEASSAPETSVHQKRRKKRKKRDSPSADSGKADGSCEKGTAETSGSVVFNQGNVSENNKERKKKKLLVNEVNETKNVVTDTRDKHSTSVQSSQTDTEQSKKTQSKKTNPKVQNVSAKPACQNGPANANGAEDVSLPVTPLISKVVKKKQKAESILVNGDAFLQQTGLKSNKESLPAVPSRDADSEYVLSKKVKLKKKAKLVSLEGMKVSSQKAATLKKKRKVKEVLNSAEANGVLETACKKSRQEVRRSLSLPHPTPQPSSQTARVLFKPGFSFLSVGLDEQFAC